MSKTNGAGEAVKFTLDGEEAEARPGETIFQVAARQGIELPHLCYAPKPGYRPDGNCRVCMVEIEGERVLAASCIRTPTPGMKVKTQTDRAKTARRMVVELLMADQPARAKPTIRVPNSGRWRSARRSTPAAFRARRGRNLTAAIQPWRSISMPAFTATCASARAARYRSTT